MKPDSVNKNQSAIETVLAGKSDEQLKKLILDISIRFPESCDFILRWQQSKGKIDVSAELAFELWGNAESIISQFNEYGGGPDEDEEEACEYINELCDLIPKLSWDTRREIVDEMLVQYHYGNSGFDDLLTDTCHEMCKEQEELLYLAEKFMSFGGRWDKNRAMSIYSQLGADEKYLEIRTESLEYGNDYLELAQYYEQQGNIDKALIYAHQGLKKGEGALNGLVLYLFDYYESKNDTKQLESLKSFCETKSIHLEEIYNRLFAYYKTADDYENAKEYILKKFEVKRGHGMDKLYGDVKVYLNKDDWNTVEPGLFLALKERDLPGYMEICLKKSMKQEVCDIVTGVSIPKKYNPWSTNFDSFADKIAGDFPDEIIKYYWERVVSLVESGAGRDRENYIKAMNYLKKVKNIYLRIQKNKLTWENRLAQLRTTYQKRRAFLEESRVLD